MSSTVAEGETKGKNETRCFARRHMSMAASAYHSYAFGVSRTSAVFYSDDRRDAEEFGVSNKTIFDLRTWLEHHGWLLPIDKGSKRKRNPVTGHWLSIRYRVLSHDEWAATHHGCRFPRPGNKNIPPDVKSTARPDVESTSGPDVESAAGEQSPDVDSSFTGRRKGLSPDVVSTAKVVSESLKREVEAERENPKPAKPAAAQTAAALFQTKSVQHPVYVGTPKTAPYCDKLLAALRTAGLAGCSATELTMKLYDESAVGLAYCRIVQIVGRLRKKGYRIISTGNGGGAGVYVLREN